MAAVSASPCIADLGRNATLAGLVVASNYRRKSVGSQLLSAAEASARVGCTRASNSPFSRSRRPAHQFYLARDYEETSDRQARYIRPLGSDLFDGSRLSFLRLPAQEAMSGS